MRGREKEEVMSFHPLKIPNAKVDVTGPLLLVYFNEITVFAVVEIISFVISLLLPVTKS
jgi:hypothetical protein